MLKFLRIISFCGVVGFSLLLGIFLSHRTPSSPIAIDDSSTSVPTSTPVITYYVDNDGPVDAYSCPNIDCDVVTTFTSGTVLSVVGSRQGDALLPVRYQNTIVYVMDTWLSPQPNAPALSLSREVGGPSAQCRDGWTSFSQNRRGTCSHHGGVKSWYRS